MPSHNIKGKKNNLLDAESHSSVSAVVRANANNWLINTKALINQEKAKSNQYKIQSSNYKDSGKPKSDKLLNIEAKNVEKARIKMMDAAHYSLSGHAARERQGLWPWQPLDMSTVGGNTRHGKGGLDEYGGYLDKDFMSYTQKQNFTGGGGYANQETGAGEILPGIINLKSRKELEDERIFGQIPSDGDSYEPTPWTVRDNTGLVDLHSKELITDMLNFPYKVALPNEGGNAFYDGKEQIVATIRDEQDLEAFGLDSWSVWKGKSDLNNQQVTKMENLEDHVPWYTKAGDFIYEDVLTPIGQTANALYQDLAYNNTETTEDDSILGKTVDVLGDHFSHSYRMAAYDLNELKENVVEIGGELKDHVYSYGHAVQSLVSPFTHGEFRDPHEFEDDRKREEHRQKLEELQKDLELEKEEITRKNVIAAHKQYGESRVAADKLAAEASRAEAEAKTELFYQSGSTIGEQRENYLKNAELSKKYLDNSVFDHGKEGEFQARKAQLAKEAEAKRLRDILDRQSEELKGGEREARNFQKRKLELERQEKENTKDGVLSGESSARQVHKMSKIKDKLDEERNTKDVGLEGYVNDGTVSPADQAIFDKAKNERLRHHLGILRDETVMKGLGSKETGAIVSDHMDRNYAPRKEPHRLMATDPYAFSTHAYPKDVVEDFTNGHYMLFYINVQNITKYTYDGYDDKNKSVTVGDMVEREREHETVVAGKTLKHKTWTMEKGANAADIAYEKRLVSKGIKGNLLKYNQIQLKKSRKGPSTGLNSYYPTTTRITDSVALYLPPSVQDNTSAQYNDFETGMAGFLAMGGVDILQQLRDHDFQGAARILMNSGTEIAKEALKKFALGGFGALTGSEGVRQTFDKAFGQAQNPYLEVTFTTMGLRNFNYTFHFAPKSPEESLEVKDIINLFRFHMAPELKGTNHRYLTIPSTFDIHYMFQSGMGDRTLAKENSFYSKIATCVLKGVDVNYTPGGVKSFDDGAPTQIDMTLSFQETEMLTKQKINEGF